MAEVQWLSPAIGRSSHSFGPKENDSGPNWHLALGFRLFVKNEIWSVAVQLIFEWKIEVVRATIGHIGDQAGCFGVLVPQRQHVPRSLT